MSCRVSPVSLFPFLLSTVRIEGGQELNEVPGHMVWQVGESKRDLWISKWGRTLSAPGKEVRGTGRIAITHPLAYSQIRSSNLRNCNH